MYMPLRIALGKLKSAVSGASSVAFRKTERAVAQLLGIGVEEYGRGCSRLTQRLHYIGLSKPKIREQHRPNCDQIIVCGDTAVLIEAKLATCPAADRYSGDYQRLRLISTINLSGQGCDQLLNAVKRVGTQGADSPDYLKGIKKIFQLSSRATISVDVGREAYLNKRFKIS